MSFRFILFLVIIYLVIKCGGEDLKDGVSINNIEMRALN